MALRDLIRKALGFVASPLQNTKYQEKIDRVQDSAQEKVKQAIRATYEAGRQGKPIAPGLPTTRQANAPTIADSPLAGKHIADFAQNLYRIPARTTIALTQATNRPDKTFTPQNRLEKFFLGNEPVRPTASNQVSTKLQEKGISPALAKTLAGGLALGGLALDVTGTGNLSKKLAKETSEQAIKKLVPNLSDDVVKKIAKETDVRKIEGLVRDQVRLSLRKPNQIGVKTAQPQTPTGVKPSVATGAPAPLTKPSPTNSPSRVSVGESTIKVKGTWDNFKQQFLNRYDPIEQLVKGKNVAPSQNPATLLKRLSGGMGIANAKIDNELTPLLRSVDNLDDFRALLIAERSTELAGRGIGKTGATATKELFNKLGPEKFVQYQRTAEGLRAYQDDLLRQWKEVGGLSEESYQAIKASNQKYIPFNRVIDDLEKDGFIAGISDVNQKAQVIRKIKGSERDIIDPLESVLKNTYEMTKAIEKNRAVSALAKLGEFNKINPQIIPVARVERQGQIFPEVMDEVARIVKQYGGNIERKLKTGKRFGYFESAAGDVSGNLEGTKLVTKFGTSKDTLLHEFGHLLDTKFGLRQNGFFDNEVSKELRAVADLRQGRQAYTRKGEEKVAEFVSMYFSDNKNAQRVAPITTKKFNQFLTDKPELKSLFGKMKSRQRTAETTTETIFGQSQFEPKAPHITFFENGKKVYYEAPKDIADAIKGINEEHLNLAVQAMALPARMMRAGATGLNVGFAVPNLIRDQLSAAVYSRYGGVPIYDFLSGLTSVLKKDDLYKKWLLSGADQASFFSQDRTAIQRTLGEVTGKKLNRGKWLNPLELARVVGEFSEKGSRVGVFKRALKGAGKEGLKGFDQELAAMVEAREATVDFARRGSKMKSLNAIIPFLNARTQGSLKLIESFRKRPLQTGAIGVALATVPAATLYAHNRQYAEYDEIPDYIKDNNFIIMTGDKDTPFYKIPKGEVGQIFANPMENLLDFAYNKDRKSFVALAGQLLGTLSPVQNVGDIIPTAAKVPLESIANYDTFRQRNIVSPYKKDLPPELQFDNKTSETAKYIGGILKKSPAKIEHIIRGLTAGLGGQALLASDYLGFGKEPAPQNLPVIDRFLGEQKDLSKTAQKIYEDEDKRKQEVARTNFAIKQRIQKAIETNNPDLLMEAYSADPEGFKGFVRTVTEDIALQDLSPQERAIRSLPKKEQEKYGLEPLATTGQPSALASSEGDVMDVLSQLIGGEGDTKVSTNAIKLDFLKDDGDIKGWLKLAGEQEKVLLDEMNNPTNTELQRLGAEKKLRALRENVAKYKSYGGFKKGKKGRKGSAAGISLATITGKFSAPPPLRKQVSIKLKGTNAGANFARLRLGGGSASRGRKRIGTV